MADLIDDLEEEGQALRELFDSCLASLERARAEIEHFQEATKRHVED